RAVERGDPGRAYEQVARTAACLPAEELRADLAVVRRERPLAAETVRGEPVAQEDLACLGRRDRPVVDAPLAVDREPEQRQHLARRDDAAPLVPLGLAVLAADEMRRDARDPARVDLRRGAEVHAVGRDALGRDDPPRPPARERAARE